MDTDRQFRSRSLRLPAVAFAVVVGLLAASFGGGSASAQSIDDLRARAQAIANELEVMREQEAILGEQMNQVQENIKATQEQIEETKAAIEDAKGRFMVLEVNSMPAWKGLQKTTEIDIAAALAGHVKTALSTVFA